MPLRPRSWAWPPPPTATATGWPDADGSSPPTVTRSTTARWPARRSTRPIAHIVATADGKGYWLVAGDGGIFSFGDAGFYGSMGGKPLNAPVVGIAPTPDGKGYWLVASRRRRLRLRRRRLPGLDGRPAPQRHRWWGWPPTGPPAATGWWRPTAGIFSFERPFYGSTGSLAAQPAGERDGRDQQRQRLLVRGLRRRHLRLRRRRFPRERREPARSTPRSSGWPPTTSTGGYWLVGADGGVFSYRRPSSGRLTGPRLSPAARSSRPSDRQARRELSRPR